MLIVGWVLIFLIVGLVVFVILEIIMPTNPRKPKM